MNMHILNLNAILFIGRLLQGDGRMIVELKEAMKIWTTLFARRDDFNQKIKKQKKLNKKN